MSVFLWIFQQSIKNFFVLIKSIFHQNSLFLFPKHILINERILSFFGRFSFSTSDHLFGKGKKIEKNVDHRSFVFKTAFAIFVIFIKIFLITHSHVIHIANDTLRVHKFFFFTRCFFSVVLFSLRFFFVFSLYFLCLFFHFFFFFFFSVNLFWHLFVNRLIYLLTVYLTVYFFFVLSYHFVFVSFYRCFLFYFQIVHRKHIVKIIWIYARISFSCSLSCSLHIITITIIHFVPHDHIFHVILYDFIL